MNKAFLARTLFCYWSIALVAVVYLVGKGWLFEEWWKFGWLGDRRTYFKQ